MLYAICLHNKIEVPWVQREDSNLDPNVREDPVLRFEGQECDLCESVSRSAPCNLSEKSPRYCRPLDPDLIKSSNLPQALLSSSFQRLLLVAPQVRCGEF